MSISLQFTSGQQSSAIQQAFGHLSSVSPSFSALPCSFECNIAVIIRHVMQHLNFSLRKRWFTSYSPFNLTSHVTCEVTVTQKRGQYIDVSYAKYSSGNGICYGSAVSTNVVGVTGFGLLWC